MKKEIVMARVKNIENKLCMAMYEDGVCVELRIANEQNGSNEGGLIPEIGDIYIGRVDKVIPSLNAAFIEIAKGVSCYYPLKEIGSAIFTKKIAKKGICEGEELLVQVLKEGVKTKQATVTTNLSFKGTYTVLTTGNTTLGVSSKIVKEKKDDLKGILTPLMGQGFGLIARTNAANVDVTEIINEVKQISDEMNLIKEKASTRKAFTLMKKNSQSHITFLEDVCSQNISKITIEDHNSHEDIQKFLNEKKLNNCQLHFYQDDTYPLEKLYSLESRITEALYKKVWLKSGAYLVIEPTEALTVIDVNSGKAVNKKDTEASYMAINKEATKEIIKQLRIRNISGIILVDFINMKDKLTTKNLVSFFEKELLKDRVATQVFGMTSLQLLEMTRKKTHKTLMESLNSK